MQKNGQLPLYVHLHTHGPLVIGIWAWVPLWPMVEFGHRALKKQQNEDVEGSLGTLKQALQMTIA